MKRFLFLCCLAFPRMAFTQTDTLHYSIVFAGQVKGFDKEWKNPDGSYTDWYQYNDRGRGDSVITHYKEDAQGFPVYISASGVDYMKNVVSEEFSLANGIARWKNNAEDEQRTVKGKLFYSALKTGGGHLIKALKANSNRISLLPYGDVRLAIKEEHSLEGRKVWLAELRGQGLVPNYLWIDADDNVFAYVSEWSSTIRKGYEKYVDELLAINKKYQSSLYSNLAASITQKADNILIQDVSVFDSRTATMQLHKDVYIENGSIKKIAAANSIKNGAKRIDGKGKTLVPGLWDMHVHFADDLDGILHMAAGVTHVRDMGNSELLLTRIERIKNGEIIGPRVEIMSGFIDGAGKFAAPTGSIINNVEEGKKAIQQYASKGYQQIKLYSSIRPEWVKPLAEEARKYNLRVAGHIPAFMTATQAIQAGYNEVTHMNMLALNFMGDTVDTRSPLRFSLPAQKTAGLDLEGTPMKTFIALLKSKGIAVDPTLGVFEDLFTARDKVVPAKFSTVLSSLPAQLQRNIRAGGGGLPVPEGMDAVYRRSFDKFLQITKKLYDNGITIFPGTDGFAGFDLQRELELYVKAGIPANQVLRIATLVPAMYTHKNEYGSIKEGGPADLVMVEGNPVADISNIRKTRLVITQGKMYDTKKLYQGISINMK